MNSTKQDRKDYKVVVEYKHLGRYPVGGVYVIPDLQNLRIWHGVIFVRRGLYATGIFKFIVHLPPDYGDADVWPSIVFKSEVFNPYVEPDTGNFPLKMMMPAWNSENGACMLTAMTYLKKIFYTKDFNMDNPPNSEAYRLFHESKDDFELRVFECVKESILHRYEADPCSMIIFSEPCAAHLEIAENIMGKAVRNTTEELDESTDTLSILES